MGYSNSPLVSYKRISPNRNSPRNHAIDTISVHCYVGQVSVEDMASWFAQSAARCSCNYGLGVDGRIALIVEEKDRSWCTSSRSNDNRAITIECASDRTHPYAINSKVYNSLLNLLVDICKRNGKKKLLWFGDKNKTLEYNPKADEMIMTVHRWFANKACPGDYIYSRLGTIAKEVTKRLGGESGKVEEQHIYRVRKTWADEKSQTNAYFDLNNAKAEADRYPGYSVYDENGKCLYTSKIDTSDIREASGIPPSKEWFIEAVGTIAKDLAQTTDILASVPTAMACLETGFGLGSDSTQLVKVNNLLGMKTDLLNGTWKEWTVWNGKHICKKTPEYHNGQLVYVDDYFRCYTNYRQCLLDFEQFLLHVRNNKGYKYASIKGMKDPAAIIRRIRIGTGTPEHPEGYCTDPNYESKILTIINTYGLRRFDGVEVRDKYAVQRYVGDKYRVGLYHNLDNAISKANELWGYKVYDIDTNELVYEPSLTPAQKYVATLVEMNQVVEDDIKDKEYWYYQNKNTSKLSPTFEDARKTDNRKTNCVTAVQWALLRAGVVNANRDGIQWYGNKGIVWVGKDAEKNAKKYFDIISVDRTVAQCIADNTLQPGDILTYDNLAHTNVYIGNNLSFDAGHANCEGSGEGAKFRCWISSTPYLNYKVKTILRLKAGKSVQYRVQCGAYKNKSNADKQMQRVKQAGFDAKLEQINGNYVVQAGLFDNKGYAERLRDKIKKANISCSIEEQW